MWFVECRHRATVSFVFFRVEEEAVRRQRCFCCGSEVFLCDSRVKQEHGLGVKLSVTQRVMRVWGGPSADE